MSLLEMKNIKKSFNGVEVLKDISLTVDKGEVLGIIGPSGSGKSTLLRCINGLEKYDSGSLKVDGIEVKDRSEEELRHLRKEMGMIFQSFSLVGRRNVAKNVALPMKCWKYPKDEQERKVDELLELVGISEKKFVRPDNLSGGQKQRVAIARALTLNPKILLCDEATSALDPKTTQSVLDLLQDINKKLGITIVIVTHQMEVIRSCCDTVSILENGKISDKGSVKEIFLKKPVSLLNLLGENSFLSGDYNKMVSFIVPQSETGIIGYFIQKYGNDVKIVDTSTNEYRHEIHSQFTLETSTIEQTQEILFELNKRNILCVQPSAKGEN